MPNMFQNGTAAYLKLYLNFGSTEAKPLLLTTNGLRLTPVPIDKGAYLPAHQDGGVEVRMCEDFDVQ